MFIHLKKDLQIELVDWIDSQDPSERKTAPPLAPYGVQREIQRRLSAIRTDLDSFSDAEAYALMCSGYFMTEHALANYTVLGFDVPPVPREKWNFVQIEELMKRSVEGNPLAARLKVSDRLFGKVWLLLPGLKFTGVVVGTGLVLVLCSLLLKFWSNKLPSLSWGELIVSLFGIALSVLVFGRLSRFLNYRKTLDQVLIGLGLTLGSFLAKLHLYVFDKLFLRQGTIERLLKSEATIITAQSRARSAQMLRSRA
jgi:hypothetical protein